MSEEVTKTVELDEVEFLQMFSDRRDDLDKRLNGLPCDTCSITVLLAQAAELAVALGHTNEEFMDGAACALEAANEANEELTMN